MRTEICAQAEVNDVPGKAVFGAVFGNGLQELTALSVFSLSSAVRCKNISCDCEYGALFLYASTASAHISVRIAQELRVSRKGE